MVLSYVFFRSNNIILKLEICMFSWNYSYTVNERQRPQYSIIGTGQCTIAIFLMTSVTPSNAGVSTSFFASP